MGIELPRLFSCCLCFSLRTGSLIIGYISLFSATSSLSSTCVSLYKVIDYMRKHGNEPNPNHTPEEIARTAVSVYITHAYFMLVFLYYFVISLLLIIGVHRNKTNYMRYFVNTGMFLLLLASALVIVSFLFVGIFATIPLLFWCIILLYCILVVRSAYLDMEERNKPDIEMITVYNPQQAPLILS